MASAISGMGQMLGDLYRYVGKKSEAVMNKAVEVSKGAGSAILNVGSGVSLGAVIDHSPAAFFLKDSCKKSEGDKDECVKTKEDWNSVNISPLGSCYADAEFAPGYVDIGGIMTQVNAADPHTLIMYDGDYMVFWMSDGEVGDMYEDHFLTYDLFTPDYNSYIKRLYDNATYQRSLTSDPIEATFLDSVISVLKPIREGGCTGLVDGTAGQEIKNCDGDNVSVVTKVSDGAEIIAHTRYNRDYGVTRTRELYLATGGLSTIVNGNTASSLLPGDKGYSREINAMLGGMKDQQTIEQWDNVDEFLNRAIEAAENFAE